MSLKLKLSAREYVYISGALIQNGDSPGEISILNRVPLLRQKDIMRKDDAKTACERFYLLVQCMYLDEDDRPETLQMAKTMANTIIDAAPSTEAHFSRIMPLLNKQEYYPALKEIRRLIEYEKELIHHA